MSDKDVVRRGYDELADTYAAERSPDSLETDALGDFLDSLEGAARILDAGCGQGVPVLERAGGSTEAVGVDFSRVQLRRATENAPDAALAQGDMTSLPFRDGEFDGVTAFHSVIHVPSEDHPTVVAEFARVLSPGGRLLLTAGTSEWSGTNPDWLGSGVEMRWDIAGPAETRRLLESAGFAVEREGTVEDGLAEQDAEFAYFVARLQA
ncbi:class I SAM-dependent methyltransferase [Haladaptatus salinisoli]|uniref:class I SAM-dependent methyltransferase n=1 Tax=Haladaptatus salinisoli TaxID=2884876 RepID=UPI001D0A5F7A|nr:class I SAM-dependent methyltransferase [Haladaptatus salinisoli]